MDHLHAFFQAALLGPSIDILNSLQLLPDASLPPSHSTSQYPLDHARSLARSIKRTRSPIQRQEEEVSEPGDDLDLEISAHEPAEEVTRFKGVSKHRRSGRWEAHIWIASKKQQAYLGGFETAEQAAEGYDCIALKSHSEPQHGSSRRKIRSVITNFDPDLYSDLLESWSDTTLDEAIMSIRRQSSGFSRGSSAYRGVTRHPSGKFEARIGLPAANLTGNKHIYLGLHEIEEAAARSYDSAVIRMKGSRSATNFPQSNYVIELEDCRRREEMINDPEEEPAEVGSIDYELWVRHGEALETEASSQQEAEARFQRVSDLELEHLYEKTEAFIEGLGGVDGDVEYSQGVLTIRLGQDKGTIVVNKQGPNRQIWTSGPISGPLRFDLEPGDRPRWVYRRDSRELRQMLQAELKELTGRECDLSLK